jgi:hypothetical protein
MAAQSVHARALGSENFQLQVSLVRFMESLHVHIMCTSIGAMNFH